MAPSMMYCHVLLCLQFFFSGLLRSRCIFPCTVGLRHLANTAPCSNVSCPKKNRVARLEQAVAAMGDFKGAALDALVVALKRAQRDAQEIPLESQIQAREAFLARKRIVHIDQERAAEVLRVQECERRMEELRAARNAQQAKPSPPPADGPGEVARLKQMVAVAAMRSRGFTSAPSRIRKREDYVPATDQEFLEKWHVRQAEMNMCQE